jgi:Pyridoxal-dependent decarboxylase conserved domain
LGDLLASAVNPNVAAWPLLPIASEIEAQTIRWIAEMIGYQTDCGGLFVSSGNMANLVCFFAARQAKPGWDARILHHSVSLPLLATMFMIPLDLANHSVSSGQHSVCCGPRFR